MAGRKPRVKAVQPEAEAAQVQAPVNEQVQTFVVATNRNGVNVREKPSEKAAVVGMLPNGSRVAAVPGVNAPDGWVAVENGYVMRRYLE